MKYEWQTQEEPEPMFIFTKDGDRYIFSPRVVIVQRWDGNTQYCYYHPLLRFLV